MTGPGTWPSSGGETRFQRCRTANRGVTCHRTSTRRSRHRHRHRHRRRSPLPRSRGLTYCLASPLASPTPRAGAREHAVGDSDPGDRLPVRRGRGRGRWQLAADPSASGMARALTRSALAAWGLYGIAENVALLVDELVTTAVTHGRGPIELRLEIRDQAGLLHCEVAAAGPAAPRRREPGPGPGAESGPNVLLIEDLASDHAGISCRPARWSGSVTPCLPERGVRRRRHPVRCHRARTVPARTSRGNR
jgi:anti-sigma regulatory factor (Ser/Thr protein kinase)